MRFRKRLAVALAFCGPGVVLAEDAEAPQPTIMELRLNDQENSTTLIVRRSPDGTLLVRTADLPQLRLKTPAEGIEFVDGDSYVRLGPGLGATVVFDDASQGAHITLPPSAFLANRLTVTSPDAAPVTPAGLGGFLNYDLYAQQIDRETGIGGFLDLGVFGPRGVVTNSLLTRHDDMRRETLRLESTWTLDFPERVATLRVGDAISSTGAWGRSARFGGVQFGTNFATQPTLVTLPLLSAQGEALVPSTVDVFLNGRPVASEDVPPGPFTIDRLPPITGAGQMQVVVTDALGRQQVIAQPFYTGPTLLPAGLAEYSFEAGAIREDYAQRSNAYGDPMVAGTFRRGITDYFTAEVHAEGQAGGARAAGLDAAWQAGHAGVVTLTAAAGGDGDYGWLAGAGFERNAPRFNVFARTRYSSRDFAQLGTESQQIRPRQRSFGGVGVAFGQLGTLQLSYGLQSNWSSPRTETVGLSHSVALGDYGFLSLAASHSIAGNSSTDVFLSWTLALGERRTAAVSVQHSPDGGATEDVEVIASVQQSLPTGSGSGYYAALSSSESAQLEYLYQGDSGLLGLQYARRSGIDGWRASATGGVAFTQAGVMPARRLDRSFAVVEVADFPDMTVYVENQPIGRTDQKGRVLLDSLRPYERNAVRIDPQELPVEASLATTAMTVTPAYRSGPVVRFPVVRASAATLRLVQADGRPVPAGASVTTPREQVPVAMDGLVYLTAAAGRHDAVAEWSGKRCRFTFERPEDGDPQPDLGAIPCVAEPRP